MEAALSGTPFVVVYKLSPLTYRIGRLLVRGVKNFAMVNVLAGEELVPELLQDEVTPQNIALHLESFLGDAKKARTLHQRLERLCQKLKSPNPRGAAARAAELALELIEKKSGPQRRWKR